MPQQSARPKVIGVGLALAAALAATPAAAALYAVLQSGPDEITVVDTSGVEAVPGPGEWRRAWSVNVKRSLVSGAPPQPGYVRTLNEYDCLQRRLRWRSFTVYSRFGESVLHKDNDDITRQPGGRRRRPLGPSAGDVPNGTVVSAPPLTQLVIGLMQTWDTRDPRRCRNPRRPRPRRRRQRSR